MSRRRLWPWATAVSAMAALYIYDTTVQSKAAQRNLRAVLTAALIVADYKFRFRESAADLDAVHARTAQRILRTCQHNGGLYIKLGQGLALNSAVLPPSFNSTLSILYDDAPAVSYREIKRIFMEDLGKAPEDVFASFDPIPVASASVAQVHRAILRTGEAVAVKIQKPEIQKQEKYLMRKQVDHRLHYFSDIYMHTLYTIFRSFTIV